MQILELNHVALHVKDVAESCRFYGDVLGLPTMPRPAFDFPGAWFLIGTSQHLHLIGERQLPVHGHLKGDHFAMRVKSIRTVESELKQKNIAFMGPQQRPDGIWQIFIQDPDGHIVELTELPD